MALDRRGFHTHVPMLLEVGRLFGKDIKTIVEHGSGYFSTKVFLDRKFFPALETFISYEAHEEWYKKIKNSVKDERFDYRFYENVNEIDFTLKGDLLFVDGIRKHRKKVIEYLNNSFELVICHDTDLKWFREKQRGHFKYIWEYKPPSRHTGIMSNFVDVRSISWKPKMNVKFIENLYEE